MTRRELVAAVGCEHPDMTDKEVERIVACIFAEITDRLAEGGRVELRGFGSFSTRAHRARTGRNPRTGTTVAVDAKRVPFFKASRTVGLRINAQGT